MKKLVILSSILFSVLSFTSKAQRYGTEPREKFGTTLNIGAGLGYYGHGYGGRVSPFGVMNLEMDIARNVTLAPFIGYYSYTNRYYWGNVDNPYRYYSYREVNIPLGVKGAYYFDELFHASDRWDFYAAASIGFNYRSQVWDAGYYGDKNIYQTASPLYTAGHVGARLHCTQKFAIYLDLSTAFSTFGMSFKF